ncbi:phytoene/squalene synthase family protein [Halomarina salina]|uniref:Phytoene/squalene synthase family protein n=1 Tax=Halomarina salina TaxID=1872699 RepID=A0ABD5RNJ1_9EURY|nr:phytoene/squalene synthase family protein [Halomarina salina]
MVNKSQLAQSKSIHRRTGKTFYFATRVLPERVRRSTYVLYAFFRIADEVVDDEDNALTPDEQRERLEAIRAAALGHEETDDPVLAAFCDLREETGISDEEVNTFVDAMLTDVEKTRYADYGELESYMRGSAAAVGQMMTTLMDPDPEDEERARPRASALGEAFQLTNFVRDVREDIRDRGRIYLPQTTLDRHDVTDEQIANAEFDDDVRAVVEEELRRAEALYREGVAGIKYLPEDCQFAVLLAAVLYADHHRAIRHHDYDVLSTTPQLSTRRKLSLVVRTRAYWAFSKDPEAVFARVSAVPMTDERRSGHEAGGPHPVQ